MALPKSQTNVVAMDRTIRRVPKDHATATTRNSFFYFPAFQSESITQFPSFTVGPFPRSSIPVVLVLLEELIDPLKIAS